jgi:REP element-mobilizing transposase RayT
MARPVRIEYPGAVYHVVCRGNNRQAVFRDDHDRKRYLEKLSLYCEEKDVELLCYSLLTNHVHLVLETPQGNLSKMMQAFQTSYTVYFNKRHGRSGHVFEQRYKAFLVDRDNYLLEVSRYVHLNPVAARLVERPAQYRWSSYASYIQGKGIPGLKYQKVLEYFAGGKRKQVEQYREFVEGGFSAKEKLGELPVRKQAFIGDEEFEEAARKKVSKLSVVERSYPFKRIAGAVCRATGVSENDVKHSSRTQEVQRARELLCYVSRRHGAVSLTELRAFLGVKELSTPSHALRRAETRLTDDRGFRRQLERVLDVLGNSSMQA